MCKSLPVVVLALSVVTGVFGGIDAGYADPCILCVEWEPWFGVFHYVDAAHPWGTHQNGVPHGEIEGSCEGHRHFSPCIVYDGLDLDATVKRLLASLEQDDLDAIRQIAATDETIRLDERAGVVDVVAPGCDGTPAVYARGFLAADATVTG